MKKWGWLGICLVAGGLLLAGCGDDDSPTGGPGDQDPPPVFEDPDALMAGFVAVYGEMDAEDFPYLINENARFIILPSTLAEWDSAANPLLEGSFGRDTLLTIHGNIFHGQQGRNAVGMAIPPVGNIGMELVTKVVPWAPITSNDEDFGMYSGQRALYSLLMNFDHPDQFRHRVQVEVEFFVTQVQVGEVTGWQFLGFRQLGQVQTGASESTDWCELLALYR